MKSKTAGLITITLTVRQVQFRQSIHSVLVFDAVRNTRIIIGDMVNSTMHIFNDENVVIERGCLYNSTISYKNHRTKLIDQCNFNQTISAVNFTTMDHNQETVTTTAGATMSPIQDVNMTSPITKLFTTTSPHGGSTTSMASVIDVNTTITSAANQTVSFSTVRNSTISFIDISSTTINVNIVVNDRLTITEITYTQISVNVQVSNSVIIIVKITESEITLNDIQYSAITFGNSSQTAENWFVRPETLIANSNNNLVMGTLIASSVTIVVIEASYIQTDELHGSSVSLYAIFRCQITTLDLHWSILYFANVQNSGIAAGYSYNSNSTLDGTANGKISFGGFSNSTLSARNATNVTFSFWRNRSKPNRIHLRVQLFPRVC